MGLTLLQLPTTLSKHRRGCHDTRREPQPFREEAVELEVAGDHRPEKSSGGGLPPDFLAVANGLVIIMAKVPLQILREARAGGLQSLDEAMRSDRIGNVATETR